MNCCVNDCPNKFNEDCKSYPFPSKYYKREAEAELSKKRQKAWISALRIINSNSNAIYNQRVCSRHFINGRPCKLIYEADPDWVPSLNLGVGVNRICDTRKRPKLLNPLSSEPVIEESLELSENESFGGSENEFDGPDLDCIPVASAPGVHSVILNPADENECLSDSHPIISSSISNDIEPPEEKPLLLISQEQRLKFQLKQKDEMIKRYEQNKKESEERHKEVIKAYQEKLKEKELDVQNLKLKIRRQDISFDALRNNDDRVKSLTGLPNCTVLLKLFEVVKDDLFGYEKTKFNKFDSFVITLMKLRFDLPMSFLSYTYGERAKKISKMYRENIASINLKIGPLVSWPNDDALLLNTPKSFKAIMGNKCIVLIHFLELSITNLKRTRSAESPMKHRIKYLIALTPAGEIIFVSQGFGNGATDDHVIEKSGFLDKISEHYIVLSVKAMFIENADEQTRQIRNLAANTEEKVIDLLKENFRILFNQQTINSSGEVYSEYTVRCCCALANLHLPETNETNETNETKNNKIQSSEPVITIDIDVDNF